MGLEKNASLKVHFEFPLIERKKTNVSVSLLSYVFTIALSSHPPESYKLLGKLTLIFYGSRRSIRIIWYNPVLGTSR